MFFSFFSLSSVCAQARAHTLFLSSLLRTSESSPPLSLFSPRKTKKTTNRDRQKKKKKTKKKNRGSVDKKTVLENLDLALLAIDEVVDRGLILETDPATVAQRASMAGAEGEMGGGVGMGGLGGLAAAGGPLSEQTLSKVMASAKEQLARSLLK